MSQNSDYQKENLKFKPQSNCIRCLHQMVCRINFGLIDKAKEIETENDQINVVIQVIRCNYFSPLEPV